MRYGSVMEPKRRRGARTHRSLLGELRAILGDAVGEPPRLALPEASERVRRRPDPSAFAAIFREPRDSR